MPTIALTIVDQTVEITQVGEIGPIGATGATGTVSAAGDGTAGAPGIAFASDADTGLFRPGANILAFATGANERMRIDDSGNLLIGSSAATTARLLSSGGGIVFNTAGGAGTSTGRHFNVGLVSAPTDWRAYTGSTSCAIQMENSATEGFVLIPTVGAAVPRTQFITTGGYEIQVNATIGGLGTNALQILANGNVGINTPSAARLLHVKDGTATVGRATIIAEGFLGGYGAGLEAGSVLSGGGSTYLAMGKIVWDGEGAWGASAATQDAFCSLHVTQNGAVEEKMRIASSGHITPGTDNGQNFGSGSLRWATIYAGTGTINTSDERYKVIREGGDLSEAEYLAWSAVRAIVYQDKDSYDRKGDEARLHVGYSWQTIRAAFAAQGLDANRYGLWCEDPVLAPIAKTRTVKRQVTDADGKPQTEVVPVLDAGEPVFEQVHATEKVEQPYEEVRIVDGAPVLVRGVRTADQPIFDSVQVRDAETGELLFYTPRPADDAEPGETVEGDPVPLMALVPRMVNKAKTETVPVMEDYEEEFTEMEPTGETMGALRYQECAVLDVAWLRRELARVEARVAALEPTKS